MNQKTKSAPALAILGPTGAGKSALAEALAERLDCRILNADAFQVYRGFDIGTAKPRQRDRYELLDILEPTETFSVGEFLRRAVPLLHRDWTAGRPTIVCGGTGLYVRALFESYQGLAPPAPPDLRARLTQEVREWGIEAFSARYGLNLESLPLPDRANPVRVVRAVERILIAKDEAAIPELPWHARRFKFALAMDREALKRRLAQRLDAMLAEGWVDEVKALLRAYPPDAPAFRSIGYAQIIEVVEGRKSLEQAREEILTKTWQYARRQLTWLKKEPNLVWIAGNETIDQQVQAVYGYIRRAEG